MSVVLIIFGISDMVAGSSADEGIPLGLIGLTPSQLRAESEAGYRIFDFFTRTQGLALLMFGLLAAAILLHAYRHDQRWAWWTMWALPAWAAGVLVFYMVVGVEGTEPPPPPMVSAPIFIILTVASQLISAPRFFRSQQRAA